MGPKVTFPTDPDPCASYCLKWVPPVYRDKPCLVECAPSGYRNESVKKNVVEFEEVCRPERYERRIVPDRCRTHGAVQVCPPRDEWVQVNCTDPCGAGARECWKQVRVPAKYTWCEKTETDKGFEYCAYKPAEYDVVAKTVCTTDTRRVYVPARYKVVMEKELYEPGHYAWEKRYDCDTCGCGATATKTVSKSCAPCAPRGDFRRCPSAD